MDFSIAEYKLFALALVEKKHFVVGGMKIRLRSARERDGMWKEINPPNTTQFNDGSQEMVCYWKVDGIGKRTNICSPLSKK